MSSTYTSPDNSDSDWVRFKIGDTSVTGDDAVLSDEEIAAMLTEKGNKWPASHACALSIMRKYQIYAMKASNEEMATIASTYKDMADGILMEMSGQPVTPSLPSRSIDEKDTVLDDTDRVRGRFHRGMNRLSSSSDYTRDDNL